MLKRLLHDPLEGLSLRPAPDKPGSELSPEDGLVKRDRTLTTLHTHFLQSYVEPGILWHGLALHYGSSAPGRWPEEATCRRRPVAFDCADNSVVGAASARNPLRGNAVRSLLADVGTNHWQFTRECMVTCANESYDPDSQQIRELAWEAFAAPASTKDMLESAFNFIKDSGQRQARSNRMGPFTRWSYLA